MFKKILSLLAVCILPLVAGVISADQYTETRPWGTFTILDEGENFKVKRIVVNPGQRLSLQSHEHRAEHWVIVAGTGIVTLDNSTRQVSTNDYVHVEVKQLHRIQNNGLDKLIFIETQCGDYLGEDDIKRYSDDYGR